MLETPEETPEATPKEIPLWKAPLAPSLAALRGYSAGRETAGRRLHANEMPWGEPWNRYPEPVPLALRQALAAQAGVQPECVFTGSGSDEIIDLLQRAFCEPCRDAVLLPSPTFSMYAHYARLNRLRVVTVPLRPDFTLDAQAALDAAADASQLAFLCDPNNPTGNRLGEEALYAFLSRYPGLVVMDEAYGEFAGSDHRAWMAEFPNLVLLRTLSKAWGLAGLRLGYALAHPEVVAVLDSVRQPYALAGPVRQMALRTLAHPERMQARVRRVLGLREQLSRELSRCKAVETVYPSAANFLLLRCRAGQAAGLEQAAAAAGLRIRAFGSPGPLADCLRISVGTAADHARLLAVFRKADQK
jgi:histidinol-phosphate aminotransferase